MSQVFECSSLKTENDMDLNMDINNMDFHFNSSDMMTSEFFDSVMAMEKSNLLDSIRFFNDDFLKDDEISFVDSNSNQSTAQNSPVTDASSNSDHFNEDITLFGGKTSEILCDDDYYNILNEPVHVSSADVTDNLDGYVDEEFDPIVANVLPPKVVKRLPVQSNCPKKVIVTKPAAKTNLNHHQNVTKKITNSGKNQVIRVQAGGRSLLLPVNVKDIKKLKVIRANDLTMDGIKLIPAQTKPVFKKIERYAASTSSESVDEDIDLEQVGEGGTYPALELTGEEKRLLIKEGIKLPSHYPLTKYEEKELKRIRRKIRNKISAQDSRKRKKEYVDQLEEKARRTDEENEFLKNKVKNLNRENTQLSQQLKKLQELLCSGSSKATPTTCLMIVLFSTLLVCLPNLKTSDTKEMEVGEQQMMSARRALLFNPSKEDEEQVNLEEFLVFGKEDGETRFEEEEKDNGTNAFVQYLGDLSKKYESVIRSNCSEILQGGSLQDYCKRHEDEFKQSLQSLRVFLDRNKDEEKKFIEPDISDDEGFSTAKLHRNAYLSDDDDPPTKKTRISSESVEFDLTTTNLEAKSTFPLKRE